MTSRQTAITRLTYSPRVYVFTKDAAGNLYDLTDYVVSGNVVRNIGQVSSATVTLRNPFRIFTTPSAGVAFHPQDPITIYLERIAGLPVRVFTGYLDQTPYYQLQPGVITLEASCTLKRLLYTFFDPSLPYVISFFQKYGWENSGSGSIFSPGASSATNTANAGTSGQSYNDSSFAKLLWAVLYEIGNWDDTNIWIEPLPKGSNGIVARMQALATSMQLASDAAQSTLSQFLNAVIGGDGQGSGGGTGGSGKTLSGALVGGPLTTAAAAGLTVEGNPISATQLSNINIILGVGVSVGASAQVAQAAMYAAIGESSIMDVGQAGGGGGKGVFQISDEAYSGGTDLQAMSQGWFTGGSDFPTGGAIGVAAQNPSYAVWQIANATERNAIWNDSKQDSYTTRPSPAWPSIATGQTECANIVAAYMMAAGGTTKTNSKKGQGSTTTQTSATSTPEASGASTTVYEAMISAANALASSGLPYPSPDQHYGSLATAWPAYDCSGSVSYVLYAAGLIDANDAFSTADAPDGGNEIDYLKSLGFIVGHASDPYAINVYVNPSVHTFMELGGTKGRYWGTTDGTSVAPGCGQWLSNGNTTPANAGDSSFTCLYLPRTLGLQPATYQGPFSPGGTSIPATGFSGTTSDDTSLAGATGTGSSTSASLGSNDAFVAQLTFPSIEDSIEGILLGAEGKGLMHDQSLMPFVQQVCQASMRSFQSLPNGDFFAFYPDYFGEMGQHEPYWLIDDIEILSGEIDLTDDALATHVYAVGDNTYPVSNELMNELFSAGNISIFNAFQSDVVSTDINSVTNSAKSKKSGNAVTDQDTGLLSVMNTEEATAFIKRFGARPLVQNYPQVRSTIFEMMLAYQQFMLAWSNQFVTPFSFTFMPEVFPGGKVAFPSHGFKMYVNQVTHTFDYTEGFTTTAQLSAPSLYGAGNPDLPPNMVSAIAEPVLKNAPKGNAAAIQSGAAGNPQPTKTVTSGDITASVNSNGTLHVP